MKSLARIALLTLTTAAASSAFATIQTYKMPSALDKHGQPITVVVLTGGDANSLFNQFTAAGVPLVVNKFTSNGQSIIHRGYKTPTDDCVRAQNLTMNSTPVTSCVYWLDSKNARMIKSEVTYVYSEGGEEGGDNSSDGGGFDIPYVGQ